MAKPGAVEYCALKGQVLLNVSDAWTAAGLVVSGMAVVLMILSPFPQAA